MKILIHLFLCRLSFVIKHIAKQNNVDKRIRINNVWSITLLNKKQLYRNGETIPNFNYSIKGFGKRVGKITQIKDSKFKTFRKMIPNLIKSKDKNKGNFKT